jgi:hypothetical protein
MVIELSIEDMRFFFVFVLNVNDTSAFLSKAHVYVGLYFLTGLTVVSSCYVTIICIYEQVISNSKTHPLISLASDLYSNGARFVSWSWYRTALTEYIEGFSDIFCKIQMYYFEIGHDHFLLNSFSFTKRDHSLISYNVKYILQLIRRHLTSQLGG